jgi:hypothetical protein
MKYCIDKQLNNKAIAVKNKQWPQNHEIKINFIAGNGAQINFVKNVCVEYEKFINLKFNFINVGKSDVRISFVNDGSWSYIGTDALQIPQTQATMNFGWLDKETVLHEFGHMLSLGHEHQNPQGGIQWNINNVVNHLSAPPNSWDYQTIIWNVIKKYETDQIIGTEFDPKSIMLYPIPKEWTTNGFSSDFNTDISEKDIELLSSLYPKKTINSNLKLMKDIYLDKKDLERQTEDFIIRLASLIGVNLDKKDKKKLNIDITMGNITKLILILFFLSCCNIISYSQGVQKQLIGKVTSSVFLSGSAQVAFSSDFGYTANDIQTGDRYSVRTGTNVIEYVIDSTSTSGLLTGFNLKLFITALNGYSGAFPTATAEIYRPTTNIGLSLLDNSAPAFLQWGLVNRNMLLIDSLTGIWD